MQHRHNMETVDCSFKDMRSCNKPFGGLTCVFGGDFQQILPVIPKGSHAQIVGACIQRSILWRSMNILHLYQNMHLNTSIEEEKNFAKWQLEVGQGKHTDDGGSISLPEHFKCSENTVESLVNTIYPGIHAVGLSNDYFSEKTILCGINNDVDNFNKEVLEKFHRDVQIYNSADYIPNTKQSGTDDPMLNYPIEYLNDHKCSGLPLSQLKLKIGCPI